MTAPTFLSVAADRVIGLRYIMRNRDNEVVEDRMRGEPAIYLQGSTAILPSLQAQLEGLGPGQKKQVSLYVDPGSPRPDYLFEVEVISVRAASPAELRLGYPLPVAADCGSDCDCYAEHPVAGNGT